MEMGERVYRPWAYEKSYFQTPSTSRHQSQDRSIKSTEKSDQPEEDRDASGLHRYVAPQSRIAADDPWALPPLDPTPSGIKRRWSSIRRDRDNEMPSKDGPADRKPQDKLLTLYRFATGWEKLALIVAVLCAIANGVALPMITLVFGGFATKVSEFGIGILSPAGLKHEVRNLALIYVYLGIGTLAATVTSAVVFMYTGNNIVRRTRELYLRALLRQPIEHYDNENGSGAIATRLSVDFNMMQTALSHAISVVISSIASFVTGITIIFIKSWRLGLLSLAVIAAMMLLGAVSGRRISANSIDASNQTAVGGSIADESFSAIKSTLAFGLQQRLSEKFRTTATHAARATIAARQTIGFVIAAIQGIILLAYGLLFWQGSIFIVAGNDDLQSVVTSVFALIISTFSLASLPPMVEKIAAANIATAQIMSTIASADAAEVARPESRTPLQWDGSVTLRNVTLRYASRPDIVVLKDFSAHFQAGKVNALVGASGSGKSSIISLLEGFYAPQRGKILIGDRNIDEIDKATLRKQISMVEQQPILFRTTVRQNILQGLSGTGLENAPDLEDRLVRAAKIANAHAFIQQLPNGYDTDVSERGSTLSGGQRQRIAIARAIIRDPVLLLLDEATSALDTGSEAVVQQALDQATVGRTTITIAHRLSTIRHADNIIVISKGAVVEQGTHTGLMRRNGAYASMIRAQRFDKRATAPAAIQHSRVPLDEPSAPQALERSTSDVNLGNSVALPATKESRPRALLNLVKFVARLNKPETKWLVLGLSCAVLAGSALPVQGIFFAKTITALARPPLQFSTMRNDVDFWAVMYLWFGIFIFISNFLDLFSLAISSGRLIQRIKIQVFDYMLLQDLEFFDENPVGSLVSFLEVQAAHVAGVSGSSLGTIVSSLTVIVAAIAIAIAINWRLGLVWTATAPLLLLCGFLRVHVLTRIHDNVGIAYDDSTGYASEAVAAIRTVLAFTREDDVVSTYHEKLLAQGGQALKRNLISSGLYSCSEALPFFCLAIGFYYGGVLIANRTINLFQFFVAFAEITFGSQSAGIIFTEAPDFGQAIASARFLTALFDRKTKIDLKKGQHIEVEDEEKPASLRLENLSFTYAGRKVPAVKDINVSIQPGQKIAFVGESGCGKSTTISLIERFYLPQSGRILFNGRDISGLNTQSYRSRLALVDQVPALYQGTIKENILYGLTSDDVPSFIADAALEKACRDAHIYDFIMSLPEGFNSIVGNKGILLSGGQRQRLSIARAIIRQPQILLLDEATSALDTESEKTVQAALDTASRGRTTITVAHRLSTIQSSDVIYVFDKGRIVEQGTHSELMAKRAKYFKLAEKQIL